LNATPQPAPTGTSSMTTTAAPTQGSNKLYNIPLLEENGSNFAFWKYRVELVLQI